MSCCSLCLLALGCCALCPGLPGLGWRVASGFPVLACGCGCGVEVGVAASALLSLVRLELYACRHTGMCAPPPLPFHMVAAPAPCVLSAPGLVAPLPLAPLPGRATSHCLPGAGVAAWLTGLWGSGCAPVGGAGCLDPGHE